MSSSKGKGRAEHLKDEPNQDSSAQESLSPSLLSRVAASATGLTRNAFIIPNPNELNQQAASALSNSNKTQHIPNAGASSSTWAESSRAPQAQSNPPTSSSGLRAGHSELHAQASENEFSSFLDGIDSFVPSESFGNIPVSETSKGFDEAWVSSRDSRQPIHSPENWTITEQEQQDGSEVLAILSDLSALDSQMEEPPPLLESDEDYDWGLTSAQIAKLRELTKDILPAPSQHANTSADNSLNLLPDFQGQEGAREQYVEEWESVLNRYADEVWGGLAPLVREARKEVEEAKSNPTGDDKREMKAVRRLGAILGHLGQH
ncbi:hypothetical protein IFR04_006953 [Cadophora malorum]|uniref:Uncharacterized protein n=1 Tax=Cadophora malorum TaxID=108018 RepID=A0A8H7TJ74_9HELO|nr:hypothetical protein IFR04_006953 [Cadophora malorum]